ncbi:tRNA (adenosine(37)-N6)-threonylcarbamoyltransferase complex ATPase subunit type 1 TsaE [Cohnella silvisoli]|uniref:tRNA threonylcarbamoyladenosine biosynthesis protein TsaE n=1 Tax=Cohnella silvisoli TaxID=2873699 RepID=A0ABV1KVV1_9BACL|nr:tRNA (adenosine(37)-N6)-threonylcarbamoyltransferase complex ATPase subunit type 1 TsaE [Cohnella silvisoli]MCD9023616.1 tRNA (adenosine(37)-N6)-threonylcarbamoyltransferase complex ATPase subunit type 1 TsaE [Cohnella silvisoli]
MEFIWEAPTEAETIAFANALAQLVGPGTVLAVDGDLGAGKTRFAQAFAAAIGVPGIVNSPTYTIIKEYVGRALPFYHMDVYRLSLAEADELGLDEYFHGEGVTLVEWASIIQQILPLERLHIRIETTGPVSRKIICSPVGQKYEEWCRQLERKQLEHVTRRNRQHESKHK